MRTLPYNSYSIFHEPWAEAWKAKRHNRALVLSFRDAKGKHRVVLDSGESDQIDVFREFDQTIILSTNSKYGYAGLQVFQGEKEEGSFFIQNYSELEDILGKRCLDLEPITIAKKLMEYV